MKILLLFFIFTSSLLSLSINQSLLKVHSVLVPKLYLMDYKFRDKLKNNTIKIALVYKNSEYKSAQSLQKKMNLKYKNGIRTYNVESTLVHYDDVQNSYANVYYLFPSTQEDIQKVVQKANDVQALTFSYLSDDLQYGVMISLGVANKIKPILNLSAVQLHNISLRPILINISSIYIHQPDSRLHNFKIRGFISYRVYQV